MHGTGAVAVLHQRETERRRRGREREREKEKKGGREKLGLAWALENLKAHPQ